MPSWTSRLGMSVGAMVMSIGGNVTVGAKDSIGAGPELDEHAAKMNINSIERFLFI